MKELAKVGSTSILSWDPNLEAQALEQAKLLAELPFIHNRVCIMADGHSGYGVPIGGVFATQDCILPYGAGNDIGCGVIVCRTNYCADDIKSQEVEDICGLVRKFIPMGNAAVHPERQFWQGFEYLDSPYHTEYFTPSKRSWIEHSLGTLGSGNHFISLERSEDNNLYIMIHSGSRNLGAQICSLYTTLAQQHAGQWYINLPHKDLAYLPATHQYGHHYLQDMNFALRFAKESRARMLDSVKNAVLRVLGRGRTPKGVVEPFSDAFDVHHNFISLEKHDGKHLYIHRKGAIHVPKGGIGVIPGSQGTASYIVEGLGSKVAFESCSHGAGRRMGRKEATRTLNISEEAEKMSKIHFQGWLTSNGDVDLGEAPGAYKDIEQVMLNQTDLVQAVNRLLPMGVVKG